VGNVTLRRILFVCTTSSITTFQVVGNRGTVEINPRETMAKESSVIGVMLGQASEVQNIKIVSQII